MLGAGGVGKSCLTAQFVQNLWIDSYDPTIEDSYRKVVNVDGKTSRRIYYIAKQFIGRQIVLEILDTAGTEQFTAMREIYMKQGQGFLLVFSITNLNSFYELAELREQIIRIKEDDETHETPIVVVGNKSDLEDDRAVSRARAFQLAQSWGQKPYFETSARRRTNVDEVFLNLCRQILQRESARNQLFEQAAAQRRSTRPNRHDRRRRRNRDRCVIL